MVELKNMTIEEISERLGIGQSTVSRVLNTHPHVNETTRRNVLKILEELSYKPSGIARSLTLKKTNTIGLIIPDVKQSLFPDITKSIEDEARINGYNVILCHSDNRMQKETDEIGLLVEKRVDGLIITPSVDRNDIRIYQELRERRIPFVLIGSNLGYSEFNFVGTDEKFGSHEGVTHLINLGHRKIGYIDGVFNLLLTQHRLEGYRQALDENGIHFCEDLVKKMEDQYEESGYKAAKSLLKMKERVTAIFGGTGLLAVGAYLAIREEGLNVPDDIALITLTGMRFGAFSLARFTTMQQPSFEFGKAACDILIEEIEKGIGNPKKILLKSKLMIRETCGAMSPEQEKSKEITYYRTE